MTAGSNSFEANLLEWEKEMIENHAPEFKLADAEEVSADQKVFPDNKCSTADWNTLMRKCGQCIAFSATECGITKVEAPEKTLDLEVLDFSNNSIESIDFVKKFPSLVSLSLSNCNIKSFDELKVLKELTKLQILELSAADGAEECAGCKDAEELHEKIFELIPDLISFNGLDKGKEPVMMEGEDEEEEGMYGFGGLEEEDLDELEEEGDWDEDLEGLEEEDDEDEEPAAKRQKTD